MKLIQVWRCAAGAFAAILLAGCSTPPAFQVTQPAARVGTVESIRSEVVQNVPNAVGTIGGALVGGGLGSLVGGGNGRTLATVVGAAGGAYIGNQAATRSTTMVWHIGIRYDDGSQASIQQTSSPGLRIGDRVRVTGSGVELLPKG